MVPNVGDCVVKKNIYLLLLRSNQKEFVYTKVERNSYRMLCLNCHRASLREHPRAEEKNYTQKTQRGDCGRV
jgi:hypothetical protein